jgi:hypothetical protein
VLLGRRGVIPFDDHRRLAEALRRIALADAVMAKDVRVALGMQAQRILLHCLARIGQDRQVLVIDLDELAGPGGDGFAFSHHQRHLVAHVADLALGDDGVGRLLHR